MLIYLGDYSLNTTDEQTSSLLHKTKAKMFYIFGNHEGYHSRFYRESLHAFYKTFHDISAINNDLFFFKIEKLVKKKEEALKI